MKAESKGNEFKRIDKLEMRTKMRKMKEESEFF